MTRLIFLKLGGSLITDKTRAYSPRLDVLTNLSEQIAGFLKEQPSLRLLLGHGSGSFGHTAGRKYGTRQGVKDPAGWQGFVEVHRQAALLNAHVMEALFAAGLPALSLPPLASVTASDGRVAAWDTAPLIQALERGLLPVIYGDTVFDEVRGGTILSTEDLFSHLARELSPERILLAGLEPGVWDDFPARTRLLEELHAADFESLRVRLGQAEGVDVTGGMLDKVAQMVGLVQAVEGLEVVLFSGAESGAFGQALRNERIGTHILL